MYKILKMRGRFEPMEHLPQVRKSWAGILVMDSADAESKNKRGLLSGFTSQCTQLLRASSRWLRRPLQ